MEEAENLQKNYEDFTWKEKRALNKEFNTVKPRSKIWLAVVVFGLLLGLVGSTFQIVYLYLDKKIFAFLFMPFYITFVIINTINLVPTIRRNGKFFEWLKNDKNIVKGINGEIIKK